MDDGEAFKRPRLGDHPSDPGEIRIPQQFVGWLKGKSGQQIRDIEVRTGAQISIDQTTKELGYSRVVLLGNPGAIQAAHETITHELKRVMDRDGVSEALTILPGEHFEETQIPQKYVGWLKGSGGAQLRDMESRSGAKIRVDQSTRDQGFSVAQITGTSEAVRHCRSLIETEIARVQERDRVIAEHAQRQPGVSQGMTGLNEVQIPQQYVGWIKGSGGGQIKAIEQRTGATVTIDQGTKDLGYSRAVICGAGDAVRAAREFIESELARVFERDGIQGAPRGAPGVPGPAQLQPHAPASNDSTTGLIGAVGLLLAATQSQQLAQRPQAAGLADALAPLLGALAGCAGGSGAPPAAVGGGCGGPPCGGGGGGGSGGPGASEEEMVRIPNESVGWLKGRQGAMIRDIEGRSGAQVDIDQSTREQGFSMALVRGLPQQRKIGCGLVIAEVCKAMDSSREPMDSSFPGIKQEFQIDPSHVGWVKGPRGKVVQDIQIKSGTRIDVDQTQTGQSGCAIVKVFGTRDATNLAKQLIARELQKISPEAAGAIVADVPGGFDGLSSDGQQRGFAPDAPQQQAFGGSPAPVGGLQGQPGTMLQAGFGPAPSAASLPPLAAPGAGARAQQGPAAAAEAAKQQLVSALQQLASAVAQQG